MKTKTKLLSFVVVFLIATSALSILQHQAKSATSGLVASWHFDEDSGDFAHDASGNGNDGTVNGASWTTGISNGALQFNGINDYVEVSDSASLKITNSLTLEAWIYPNFSHDTKDHSIVAKGRDLSTNGGYQMTVSEYDGPLGVRMHELGFFIQNSATPKWIWLNNSILNNRWTLVAGVYDGSTMKLYVNGKLRLSEPQSGDIIANSYPLDIGARKNTAGNLQSIEFWNGTIDEVKIYNRALTSDEVYDDYIGVEQIPIWMQWWFLTIIALGAIVVVLGFTTVHYRNKRSVSKETSTTQNRTTPKARVCPRCGASLPADSKFCGKCGTSLE
jgi:ribosomal protein L40E